MLVKEVQPSMSVLAAAVAARRTIGTKDFIAAVLCRLFGYPCYCFGCETRNEWMR